MSTGHDGAGAAGMPPVQSDPGAPSIARYYVAAFDAERNRIGKIHRSQRPAAAKRNRSHYRTVCGRVIYYGLPVADEFDVYSLCLRCWPLGGKR